MSECSAVELEQLMTLRGRDAVDKIHDDYGGLEQLCRRLGTDPVNGRSAYTGRLHVYIITGLHPLSIFSNSWTLKRIGGLLMFCSQRLGWDNKTQEFIMYELHK